eukprot:gene9322-9403_t
MFALIDNKTGTEIYTCPFDAKKNPSKGACYCGATVWFDGVKRDGPGISQARGRLWMDPIAGPADTIVPTDGAISRLRRGSLRSRLVLLVLLASVPLVGLSLLSTADRFGREREKADALIVQMAHAQADALDLDMDDTVRIVRGVASLPSGSALAALEDVRGALAVARPYLGIALDVTSTADAAGDPVFKSPMRWSDPASAGLSMTVAVALAGSQPRSMEISISRAHLQALVMRRQLPEGWISAFVDQSGVVVARSRRSEDFVGTDIIPAVRDGLAARAEGIVHTRNVEGVESSIAFARAPKSGFFAAIALPTQVLEAPQRREMIAMLTQEAVATAVAILLALLLARQISLSLRGVASDLALGREPRSGAAEIVDVARSLQTVGLQRQKAVEALREQAGDLRRILDALPVAVLVMDARFNTVFANRRSRASMRQEFLTADHRDTLFHPDDLDVLHAWRRSMANGESVPAVSLRLAVKGAYRWNMLDGIGMREASSGIVWIVAMLQDVHTLHEAQAELAHANDELEARVAERTLQLTETGLALHAEMRRREAMQDALLRSQKQEALGQLTGGIAHDVNNVLAVVANSYAVIEAHSGSAEVLESVSVGLRAVDHAASLARALMAFARQQPLSPERIDPAVALPPIADLCRHALVGRHRLTLDVEPGLAWIEIDREMLQAALLNLVANARDAMHEGGVIEMTARTGCGGGIAADVGSDTMVGSVVITVRDCGAGMTVDELARATDPFFTTKRDKGGSGLGLTMVQGFVAQSGGELRIASVAGEGTTVSLWLPSDTRMPDLPGAGAQVGAVVAASPAETPLEARPGRLTVLVVDDNALLLNATERLLKTLHHDVLCAPDAQTAFELVCCRAEIGLVLSDVSMLGESGAELAERLAVLRPELPVILMTGYAWDVVPSDGLMVLSKPFSRQQLVAAIATAVASRPGGPSHAAAVDRQRAGGVRWYDEKAGDRAVPRTPLG